MFSVLVADYDKTLPESVFLNLSLYGGALRAQTIRELTSATSDSPHYVLILSFLFTLPSSFHTLLDTQ